MALFPVILFLIFFAFLALKAVNHRRGLALVLLVCGVVMGLGLLTALTKAHRAGGLHSATVVLREAPAPPVAAPLRLVSSTDEGAIPLAETKATPNPAWVGQAPQTVNGDRVLSVVAGPHATEALCEKDLTIELRKALDAFIEDYIGQPGAARRVALDMTEIRDRLVRETHYETVQASFGPMKNLHARVVIDRPMQDQIRRRYQDALVQARLGYAGGAFGLVLILLGTAFGYLRLDTATKGYYSGRLKLAATAVILTAAAATALVVRQADPAAEWPVGFPARETSQFAP